MRIAHALEMPVLEQGGVEVLVRTLIEHAPLEQTCYLLSPDKAVDLSASSIRGIENRHFQITGENIDHDGINQIVNWLKNNQIEICHFHLGGTFAWNARSWNECIITQCAKAGITCLTTNHQAINPFDATHDPRPLWRRLISFGLRWPGKCRQLTSVQKEVHVSQHDLRISQRLFPFHKGKFEHIYHSRLEGLQDITLTVTTRKPVILNLATVASRKGQHVLAEAFAHIANDFPEWKLLLVGYHADAACVEKIRLIAQEHHLEERILLPGSSTQGQHLLAEAGIYVQPSLLEGLGLSLQEAMLLGCACIGSNTGGIPELIHSEAVGALVEPGDAVALAVKLSAFLRDENLRLRLGKAARSAMVERGMTRSAMISSYQKVYQRLSYEK